MRELARVSHVHHTHVQQGFATFMAQVYRYMTGGLILSGLTAWVCAREPILHHLYFVNNDGFLSPTLLSWVLVFAPFLLLLPLNRAGMQNNAGKAQIWFWIFSAVMGASLSNIFLFFDMSLIFRALLITGATFGACSLWGHNTKQDLSAMGRFCLLAVIGIVIASLVNLFMKSSMVAFGIDVVCILAFAGLTAYDTQKLSKLYTAMGTKSQQIGGIAILGALELYLDFINLFLAILRILSSRRR